jgi:hypothetical protein
MNPLGVSLIAASFTILLGAILAYCVRINTRQSEQAVQIAELKVQISPLWARIQTQISADLHHPHPRYVEMDSLLEKLDALTILPEERERLKVLLVERSNDFHTDITESQRQSAKMMIPLMDLVQIEARKAEP